MLKTHLKLALRNLLKYPVFSAINLGGLAIGIAASFILLVYSRREMSCDEHWQDTNRIYRVGTDFYNMGGFAMSQNTLRDLMRMSCKDVQYATSMEIDGNEIPVRTSLQERAFKIGHRYSVDSSFFRVFSYSAHSGALPAQGLAPNQTILSASAASRIFGKEDPVGKTLYIGKEDHPYKVIAVLTQTTEKSHLDPQIVLPLENHRPDGWTDASVYNYVKLKPGASKTSLDSWLAWLTRSTHKWKENATLKFFSQPITSIYFHSNLNLEISAGGNLTQVRLLAAISIFLILLAVINYINLVTARSSTRSREIGVKKTFGATRKDLVLQMMLESLLFSMLAMFIACGLIQAILAGYQTVTGVPLTDKITLTPVHYGWLLLFSLGVGTCAGLYPALYLTAFRPIISLRAFKKAPGKTDTIVRNGLVLVQFTIAASLVFISFVIYSQLSYMNTKDKGFRAEGVLLVQGIGNMGDKAIAFQQMIRQRSQVVSTSLCSRTPGDNAVWVATYRTAAMQNDLTLQNFLVDDQYIKTLNLHLDNGRNFDRRLGTDTNALILNESAVAALGLFNPIGATINGTKKVVGVIKDFNYTSLHKKIEPLVLHYAPAGTPISNTLVIKVAGNHIAPLVDWINQTARQFAPEEPPVVSFLDENFRELTAKDALLGKAIAFFTVLAIILSILGLIGLTLFTIERKQKEIGIRKVLGARYPDVMRVIAGNFTKIAAIATLIALPLSWYTVNQWLQNFAYRTTISFWTFFMTELVILTIAFSVIGLLTLKAAIVNPIKTLRTE